MGSGNHHRQQKSHRMLCAVLPYSNSSLASHDLVSPLPSQSFLNKNNIRASVVIFFRFVSRLSFVRVSVRSSLHATSGFDPDSSRTSSRAFCSSKNPCISAYVEAACAKRRQAIRLYDDDLRRNDADIAVVEGLLEVARTGSTTIAESPMQSRRVI